MEKIPENPTEDRKNFIQKPISHFKTGKFPNKLVRWAFSF